MVSKEPRRIRSMFGAIAHRYDLLNHTLSFGIDHYWRWRVVRRLRPAFSEEAPALDLCTGTGDLALGMSRWSPVVGCDFTHGMLVRGRAKALRKRRRVRFVEGDALDLPFPSDSFSAVTIAFGLRNLADYRVGLQEMLRVLRPGGRLAVLELSQARLPVLKQLYSLYSQHVLPHVGRWVSGDAQAYTYLPASAVEFLSADALSALITECGFEEVEHVRLTGGVVALHLARKKVGAPRA